jgi:hypothetical protein
MVFPAIERGRPAIVLPEQIEILAHLGSTHINFHGPLRSWIRRAFKKGDFSPFQSVAEVLIERKCGRYSRAFFLARVVA